MVKIESGELRGTTTEAGLTVFRGVPYARAERFGLPQPVEPWSGVRDATKHGPVSPQPPVKPDAVMGIPRDGLRQSEDCLSLTIVTPAADDKRRPVLVWLPGGAYVTGAGSLGYYDGQRLAAQGDVVVVGVNYRLGALGYLRLDGLSPGNLGLYDQLAALRWVQRNIAAFGGDPGKVTVSGQSAGAHSIACLLAVPGSRGLFRRAILQSAPMAMKLQSPATATRVANHFLRALGSDPRTASVEEILAAQAKAIVRAAGPGGLYTVPPFCPAGDTAPLPPVPGWLPAVANRAREVDVLIGTAKSEFNAFVNGKPGTTKLEAVPVVGRRATTLAKAAVTRWMFDAPSRRFADVLARAGGRVFTYRFDWQAPDSGFGACHCIELPFLFGDAAAWAGAPMLGGTTWEDMAGLGHDMRASWLGFARAGDPGWAPHSPGDAHGFVWTGSAPARAQAPAGVT